MVFNNLNAFWLVLLIPALIVFGLVLAFLGRRDRRRFAHTELYDALTRSISKTKHRIRAVLYMLGMFFLVLVFTEPRFGTKTEIVKRMGLDIVIALDTSYSMLAEDI